MKKTRAFLILTIALILILLSACKRSLATDENPADSSSTRQADISPTTDVENQLYIFATQTAIATLGSAPVATTAATQPPAAQATPAVSPAAVSSPVVQEPAVPAPTQPEPAAPAQPQVVVTAPPLVVPETYTLQTGEFPFCIARRFDINPSSLLRVNGLSSYSVYYAGMVLRIPKGDGGFPGNRSLMNHPTSYTVRGGDTIYTIACAFGDADPNAIAVVNNLTPPYRVAAGQVLQIP